MVAPPKKARYGRDQHTCGYPIDVVWSDAAHAYLLREGNPESRTYLEVVKRCPGCGEPLSFRADIGKTLTKREA